MIPAPGGIIYPEVCFMSGDDKTEFTSQVQLQPVEAETGFGELKNVIKKKAESNFQLNSLGGPLESDFTSR